MRFLCILALVILAGCNGASRVILADGTVIDHAGHLGGSRSVMYKRTAAGTVSYAEKSDNSESFQTAATAGAAAFGSYQLGLTQRSSDANDAAVALGAQNAATAQGAQRAAVDIARIPPPPL